MPDAAWQHHRDVEPSNQSSKPMRTDKGMRYVWVSAADEFSPSRVDGAANAAPSTTDQSLT
jgi:hypothetical protein